MKLALIVCFTDSLLGRDTATNQSVNKLHLPGTASQIITLLCPLLRGLKMAARFLGSTLSASQFLIMKHLI
jgi:hypothetical protein